jgi:hypothetical protein
MDILIAVLTGWAIGTLGVGLGYWLRETAK